MRRIIVVTGMGRSGTSLCCQALKRLGVSFGGPLIPADGANERGYYEHMEIVDIAVRMAAHCFGELGWLTPQETKLKSDPVVYLDKLAEVIASEVKAATNGPWAFKSPLVVRQPLLWRYVFDKADVKPWLVLCLRDPREVYLSIMRANHTEGKASKERWHDLLRTWAIFCREPWGEFHSEARVWFDDWFQDPQETLDQLAIALNLPKADATDLVDPALRHIREE